MNESLAVAIKAEAANTRAAFAVHPNAKFAWCQWHNKHIMPIPPDELPEARIQFILSDKPENERVMRLRNFRPVLNQTVAAKWQTKRDAVDEKWQTELNAVNEKWQTELDDVYEKWQTKLDDAYEKWQTKRDAVNEKLSATHNAEWPDNTWNGKDIFQKETTV